MTQSDEVLPCEGKLKFASIRDAEAQAVVLNHQRGIQLKAYKCKHCEWWHLASS